MTVPPGLQEYAARGPEWVAWLDQLPGLVRDLLGEWDLVLDGESLHGNTALVVPVVTAAGESAVLKVVWPHWEAEHEALALQHWHGAGAVRLLRADPRRWALLLERLSTEDLSDRWDVEACEIVGDLYGRLHRPAPPQLRTLSDQAARWADELGRLDRSAPVPHRMVEHARSLASDFAGDADTDGVLIHADLHFHKVLARSDGAWVAVGPKPLSGDPHYEPAPMLWHRWDELDGRIRDGVRDRFLALVDAAGLDEDRARDWVILRMLANVKDELVEGRVPDRDRITRMLAIAKAVQD